MSDRAWMQLPSMIHKRDFCAAVSFGTAQDKIMVLGGSSGSGMRHVSTVEVYDASIGRWSSLGKMPCPRSWLSAVWSEKEHRVYVLGGANFFGVKKRVDVYDEGTKNWRKEDPMQAPRLNHSVAALNNNRGFIVMGGLPNVMNPVLSGHRYPEVYNYAAQEWQEGEQMPESRWLSAAVTIDNIVYVMGGIQRRSLTKHVEVATMDAYDVKRRTWTQKPHMSCPRSGHIAVAVGRRIVVAGGDCLSSAEVYDVDRNAWAPLPDMNVARYGAAAVALADGLVVVVGGHNGRSVLNSVECLTLFVGDEDDVETDGFFETLMDRSCRIMSDKLRSLALLINDVHQMKIYYTAVATSRRVGLINAEEAEIRIRDGLKTAAETCTHEDAFVVFMLILNKARKDKYIDDEGFFRYESRATDRRIENSTFIRDIRRSIQIQTARIDEIDSNLQSVTKSVNGLKKAVRKQMRIDATVGFMGTVLNVVSLGVGGALLGALTKVVDFGDLADLEEAVSAVEGNDSLENYFELVQDRIDAFAERDLEEAVKIEDAVVQMVTAAAFLAKRNTPTSNTTAAEEKQAENMAESFVSQVADNGDTN